MLTVLVWDQLLQHNHCGGRAAAQEVISSKPGELSAVEETGHYLVLITFAVLKTSHFSCICKNQGSVNTSGHRKRCVRP